MKIWHVLILCFMVTGCVIRTSAIILDQPGAYHPSNQVQILDEPPVCPYKKIAILESIGLPNTLLPELLENMRLKAMEVGADAIIPGEQSEQKLSQGIIYNPWLCGYQSVGGGSNPKITGIAIKYTR